MRMQYTLRGFDDRSSLLERRLCRRKLKSAGVAKPGCPRCNQCEAYRHGAERPPAIAGMIETSSPSLSGVANPCSASMASLLT